MKLITWNTQNIKRLITFVLENQNTDTKEVNKALALELGGSHTAIAVARVSVVRCLQGFESSSEKGDKKGYSFGQNFPLTVNDWYNNTYKGGLTRNQLTYKF